MKTHDDDNHGEVYTDREAFIARCQEIYAEDAALAERDLPGTLDVLPEYEED